MKRIFFLYLLFIVVITACTENTEDIGISLTNEADKLKITAESFPVISNSVLIDSVLSNGVTGYLGRIKDPETDNIVTGNYISQFNILENLDLISDESLDDYKNSNNSNLFSDRIFPEKHFISSIKEGEIIADSCDIQLFYKGYAGDSTAIMKLGIYELKHPLPANKKYYSNFDPIKEGYTSNKQLNTKITYTLYSKPSNEKNTPANIKIPLNNSYKTNTGKLYNNYGSYIMNRYYENPNDFSNSFKFIKNVVPGFFFKINDGIGSMAYIQVAQLNVYYRIKKLIKSSTGKVDSLAEFSQRATFSGTEEVLQTIQIANRNSILKKLIDNDSCTYLKTPSGIYTELTLPIDEIFKGHDNDTINSAKLELNRINANNIHAFPVPTTLLMIPKDSAKTFFLYNEKVNSKNSFLASWGYNRNTEEKPSYNNSYVFSNISGMISWMKRNKNLSANWNKVVIIPVIATYSTSGKSTILNRLAPDLTLNSTKLVRGNNKGGIKLTVVYSKFK